MNKKAKLFFRISTGLLTALMLISSTMYIVQHDFAAEAFTKLHFPTFIIYPLAIAKISGLIVLWTDKNKRLTEWAYAGFTFDLLLAAGAHININDNEYLPALIGLALVGASYFFRLKVQEETEENTQFSTAHS